MWEKWKFIQRDEKPYKGRKVATTREVTLITMCLEVCFMEGRKT
jgi:hypothetical protein